MVRLNSTLVDLVVDLIDLKTLIVVFETIVVEIAVVEVVVVVLVVHWYSN